MNQKVHFQHRKTDSIKSTSLSLSSLTFAGCYLILLYLAVSDSYFLPNHDNFSPKCKTFECLIRIWLHALGLPSVLIIATVVVKMARVYYIFLSPARLRFSSNAARCAYVFIIMIPNFAVLVAWTADVAGDIDTDSGANESESGLVRCGSKTPLLWLYILMAYFLTLVAALVVVAVLTRKIRYSNFKDTKKVNALVFLLLYTYSFTLVYYLIIRTIQDGGSSSTGRFVLHIGHIAVVAECLWLLFVPKVYPPLRETLGTFMHKKQQHS